MTTIAESYRQEGVQLEKMEIAVSMLEAKMDVKVISSITDLSEEDIYKLRQQ